MGAKNIRIALLGIGTIGRELLRRTSGQTRYTYVALGDSSGFIAKREGFTASETSKIVEYKSHGKPLAELDERLYSGNEVIDVIGDYGADVLVDVTAAQTYATIEAVLGYADVVTSNKLPFADTPYHDYRRLVEKAEEEGRLLDYGATVGAGLKIPELVRNLGADGVVSFSGCLSGTMNYVSQRLNEGASFSEAIKEAMKPPRSYTEPDPRTDLTGKDFGRKLVIITRLLGKCVGLRDIMMEPLIPEEFRGISREEFLNRLGELDQEISEKVNVAEGRGRALWFLGSADLEEEEYKLGFKEIPRSDPIRYSKESDNVIRIEPRLWRRPVTLMGPGAGAAETATGLMSGIVSAKKHDSA